MNNSEKLKIFRQLLYKYSPNDFLNDFDFKLSLNLFENHPNWIIKKGCGVSKIQIIEGKYHNRGFLIHRTDGTSTDISFIIASKGYDSSINQRIKAACRNAIEPFVILERNKINWGIQKSPLSGEILVKGNTHIDHYNLSFAELFNAWIETINYQWAVDSLNDSKKDNVSFDYFTNVEIKNSFIAFHNTHTHLRAITKKENLKKKNDD